MRMMMSVAGQVTYSVVRLIGLFDQLFVATLVGS
jgi:hypothetical protein